MSSYIGNKKIEKVFIGSSEVSTIFNGANQVYSSGVAADPILGNNDWATIRAVCEAEEAANYWAIGDTKTDLGTDGTTRTFQIVDMQGLYNKHVVFEQVELFSNMNYVWDEDNDNTYSTSDMRLTHLPAIELLLSSELQSNLTNTTYSSISNRTVLSLTDKLYLPSEKEVLGTNGYSQLEANYCTQYQYYTTQNNRIKKYLYNNNYFADFWWTRTGTDGGGQSVCLVSNAGTSSGAWCSGSKYIAPCFSF